MNVYISQPMKNRSKEEILDERAKGEAAVRVYYPSAEFLNSYFDDYDTSEHTPMEYFAMTSELLAKADLVVFLPMYLGSGGCEVEDHIAQQYHIPRMYINYGTDANGEYNDVHLLK